MAYYDNLVLEKGMHQVAGKSFSQVLEDLDPSANYQGTPLEGLDAFERQLKRFDIKIAGGNSDVIEKFYATSNSAALFPEFVKRTVHAGMNNTSLLSQMIAAKTQVEARDYRSISAALPNAPVAVSEGDPLPEATIQVKDNLVKLQKRGSILSASYEALRFQRLDLFAVTLRQIGNSIATAQVDDAIQTLLDGDGNNNPIIKQPLLNNQLDFMALVDFFTQFQDHTPNIMLAGRKAFLECILMSQLHNRTTGVELSETGGIPIALNMTLYTWKNMNESDLIALDSRNALEFITVGDLSIEYDKLIDRQMERAAISSTYGFAKIFNTAARALEIA